MLRLLATVCILTALLTRALAAQGSPAATSPIIRLTARDASIEAIIGTPISIRADTIELIVRGSRDTIAVATNALRSVERLVGRRGFLRRGRAPALVAGAIGTVLGLIGGGIQDSDAVSIPGGALAGAAAGGVIGMLAGGTLGDGKVWQGIPGGADHAGR
jgi:hypothetical protein